MVGAGGALADTGDGGSGTSVLRLLTGSMEVGPWSEEVGCSVGAEVGGGCLSLRRMRIRQALRNAATRRLSWRPRAPRSRVRDLVPRETTVSSALLAVPTVVSRGTSPESGGGRKSRFATGPGKSTTPLAAQQVMRGAPEVTGPERPTLIRRALLRRGASWRERRLAGESAPGRSPLAAALDTWLRRARLRPAPGRTVPGPLPANERLGCRA